MQPLAHSASGPAVGIEDEVEISIHPPSPFLIRHQEEILPDWHLPIASVAIVLQRSRFPLQTENRAVETEKAELREELIRFGDRVARQGDRGFLSDFFEPKTGEPMRSSPGSITCDCVAVAAALLGYATIPGTCSSLKHPRWGTAVYPGVFISSATPEVLEAAVLAAEP